MAFGMDLRVRVLTAVDGGQKTGAVAARFAVSPAWVRRLKQRRREAGEVAPRPRPPRPGKLAGRDAELLAAVAARPDITLAELKRALALPVALSTLCGALERLGLSRKKSRSGRPSRTART